MDIKIFQMDEKDLEILKDILIRDFDEFWSFNTLKEELECTNSYYIVAKENNNIVSIFCDEDDTSMFLEGYIYAIGRQDFLIKHITPHGLADGYILKKIDSVMHLEISGQYEKKIEKLYSKKNQRHIDLKLQDKVSLKNNIFQICMNNKYIVSIEMIQDDECPIKGVINKIDDNKVIVSKLTEYGEDDGEAILKKENIDTISFLGVDEEDIQLLKRK